LPHSFSGSSLVAGAAFPDAPATSDVHCTIQARLARLAAIFVANKKSCSAHLLKLQEKTIEL